MTGKTTRSDLAQAFGADQTDPQHDLRTRQVENAYALIEALRERRRALGLTQKQVAQRMGRDAAVVSTIERLGADPRWSSVRRYASALGAVVEYRLDVDTTVVHAAPTDDGSTIAPSEA